MSTVSVDLLKVDNHPSASTERIRTLTSIEENCVTEIFEYFNETGFEYAVYLASQDGPVVERVKGTAIGADPSPESIERARKGEAFVVHHNHPSQGALSDTDWFGTATLGFKEIFAHSADGTIYWGKCLQPVQLLRLKTGPKDKNLAQQAYAVLSDVLFGASLFDETIYVDMLQMHVLSLALKYKNIVDYQVQWGTRDIFGPTIEVNLVAKHLQPYCLQAAEKMAKFF